MGSLSGFLADRLMAGLVADLMSVRSSNMRSHLDLLALEKSAVLEYAYRLFCRIGLYRLHRRTATSMFPV